MDSLEWLNVFCCCVSTDAVEFVLTLRRDWNIEPCLRRVRGGGAKIKKRRSCGWGDLFTCSRSKLVKRSAVARKNVTHLCLWRASMATNNNNTNNKIFQPVVSMCKGMMLFLEAGMTSSSPRNRKCSPFAALIENVCSSSSEGEIWAP